MLEDGVKRLRTTLKQVRLKEASCDCNKQQQQLTRSKLPLVLPCPLLRSSPELSTDKSIEAKPVESYELQQQTDFMNRVRQDRSKLLRRKESDFLAIASSAGLLKDQATGEEEVRVIVWGNDDFSVCFYGWGGGGSLLFFVLTKSPHYVA